VAAAVAVTAGVHAAQQDNQQAGDYFVLVYVTFLMQRHQGQQQACKFCALFCWLGEKELWQQPWQRLLRSMLLNNTTSKQVKIQLLFMMERHQGKQQALYACAWFWLVERRAVVAAVAAAIGLHAAQQEQQQA
jgi:hypothetical protein